MKFFKRRKIENKIEESKKQTGEIKVAIESLEREITEWSSKIGQIIIEQSIDVDNQNIRELQESVKKNKEQIKQLSVKQNKGEEELYSLEESLRNMDGKISCPQCGCIYMISWNLVFCPKCGAKIMEEQK